MRTNWEKEFDRVDAENTELFRQVCKFRMKEILNIVIMTCDDEKDLRALLSFACGRLGYELKVSGYSTESDAGIEIVKKGGISNGL